MPRFFTVVHHVVLNGCWQRGPSTCCEHVLDTSSSTPSETRNNTSRGVLDGTPVPGFGMMPLICDIAASKLVSVSLFWLVLVSQLLLYTGITLILAAAFCAFVKFEVSNWMVLRP